MSKFLVDISVVNHRLNNFNDKINRFMDERYKKLGVNTILVFIGKAGSSLIGMVMLPFYTHWLSPAEYGISDIINTYATIITGIIGCCLADAIFIYPKECDSKQRTKYYSSGLFFFLFMLAVWSIIFAILKSAGEKYNFGGVFVQDIWFIFATMASNYFQQYTQQFSRSIDKMMTYSLTGIVHTLGVAVFALLLIPVYGLYGYLWSIILSNIVAGVFCVFASGSYKHISASSFDKESLLTLLKYGVPLIPNGIMWWLVNGLNRPLMEQYVGMDGIGLYAVANKFPGVLMMLVMIFSTAWDITILEEFESKDFNRFFNKTLKVLFLLIAFGTILITACSKVIVIVFADTSYFDAWKYIPILTFGVLLQCMSSQIGGVFMAEKKSKYFFYSSIWGGLSSLLCSFVFIKYWGLLGACIAVVLSFLVMSIVRLFYAWKHINLFDIKYYISMCSILCINIFIIYIDISTVASLLSTVFSIIFISLLSRQESKMIINLIKSNIRK